MQQHNALNQVQCLYNQQIILAIICLSQEPIETIDQSERNIPFESLLQLKELPERRIIDQLTKWLSRRRFFARVDYRAPLLGGGFGRGGRETDLSEKTLDLAQALADLGLIVGGEVVEGE